MSPRMVAWGLVLVLSLGALGALGALGLWVYNQGAWVEIEVETGPRGEAARDPYLAATRLLGRMGVPVRRLRAHPWGEGPPAEVDVLVVAGPRPGLAGPLLAPLLDWVSGGGHLVVPAPAGGDDDADPLFAALGLGSHRADDTTSPGAVTMALDGAVLKAEFRGTTRLAGGAGYRDLAADVYGALVLEGRVGRGRVTALATLDPFTNRRLGEHDHAELLVRLLAPGGTAPRVAFARDPGMPGLAAWLWQRIPETLLSLALMAALFLWWRGHRFGRLAGAPEAPRRSLLEHIEAAGWFLWRRGRAEGLLEAQRRALVARAAGRAGGFGRRPHDEQVRMIARMSGLPGPQVAAALEPLRRPSPQEFVERVATLEAIRKRL
ncbi:MAG: DUF4350 domain-containing protein [Gammaproteobacteria bacterium]|nr:DUF4350 domain-containing protein [Gammaproteobacteria bacterium]